MEVQNLISIIVPIYNGEYFLHENVNSILNQTYQNLEILYICDGCTDQTVNILQEYTMTDTRLKIYVENTNHGAAYSRNLGLKMARGDWIIFLDSDDLFEIDMIETMLIRAIEENAEICCCYLECFHDQITQNAPVSNDAIKFYSSTYPLINVSKDQKYTLQLISNSSCTKLVHKNVYKKDIVFFPKIPNCEDVYYSSVAAFESDRIVYVDRVLLHYRANTGRNTLTTQQLSSRNCVWEACDTLFQYISQKADNRETKQSFYNRVCQYIYDYNDSTTYNQIFFDLKNVYFNKWKMGDEYIANQLSYFNREIYYKICAGDSLINKESICMLAKIHFIEDKAKENQCSVWGCGYNGKKLLNAIDISYKGIQHLYDSDPDKWGTKLSGRKIEKFSGNQVGNIIVTSTKFYNEIKQQIGNRNNVIYDLETEIYRY